jgi:hypothetical protein
VTDTGNGKAMDLKSDLPRMKSIEEPLENLPHKAWSLMFARSARLLSCF